MILTIENPPHEALGAHKTTGQSLSSFVTVTNKLGDETIVVFGG